MEKVAPQGGVYNSGTYNGNPMSLAAGMATIEYLDKQRFHLKVNEMGNTLRSALAELMRRTKLDYSVSGIGSMFQVFLGPKPENYQEALKCDKALYQKLWAHMLENGVFVPPSQFETCFISAEHTNHDLEQTLLAYIKSFGAIK